MTHFQNVLHQVIGLTNQLHVTILNAIVDHFHKMPCALISNLQKKARPFVERWRDNKHIESNTDEMSLTQSQQGSPVPTLAAMLWKMSLMCGLKTDKCVEWLSYTVIVMRCTTSLRVMTGHTECENSPGIFMSSWHKRGSVTGPILSTTDSTANKQQPFLFQTLATPLYSRNTQVLWNMLSQWVIA